MLKINMPAPDFSSPAYFPEKNQIKKIELRDYLGKWVILSFHPGDFTFVCSTDLGAFNNIVQTLKENNGFMLGISIDSVYVHKMWIDISKSMKDLKFPILDDSNQKICKNYDVLDDNDDVSDLERVTIIINPEGIVKYIEKADPRLGKDSDQILHKFLGLKYLYEHQSTENKFIILPANWKNLDDSLKIEIPRDIGKI